MLEIRYIGRFMVLGVLTLLLVGAVDVFAASVTTAGSGDAGQENGYVTSNGYFSASAISYDVVEAAQIPSSPGSAWTNGGIEYANGLVAGDWEIAWTLTINAGAAPGHLYTVNVTNTSDAGTLVVLYTLQFTSPSVVVNGQTMTILWDIGGTVWYTPSAIQITVA